MKRIALLAVLVVLPLVGCQKKNPAGNGVDVQAPGVDVRVKDDNVDVKTPGGEVEVNK